MRRAQQISLSASNEAQIAYDSANTAKERSIQELEEVTSLNSKITDFLDKDRAQPEDVKRAAEEVNYHFLTIFSKSDFVQDVKLTFI